MMPAGLVALFSSSPWLRVLFAILSIDAVKGSALVGAAFIADRVFLRRSPARARAVWLICLLSLVALPALWLWLPPLDIPAGTAFASPIAARASSPFALSDRLLGLSNTAGGYLALGEAGSAPALSPAARIIEWIWLAGIAAGLSRIPLGWILLRKLRGERPPEAIAELAARLGRSLGLAREARVLVSPDCAMPFTLGILAPRVLLPAGALSWDEGRLRAVLLHELAHIKRRDALANLAACAATSILWCVPVSWIAAWFLRQEQERAADQIVLAEGVDAPSYASELLELGRSGSGRLLAPGLESSFGRKHMLKERITSVLDLGSAEGARKGGRAAAFVLAAFCLVASISALSLAANPDEPILGTWAPDRSSRNQYKYEYQSGGKCLAYPSAISTLATMECRYTIEKKWKDEEGNTWYRTMEKWSYIPYDEQRGKANMFYSLSRIDKDGTAMESMANDAAYVAAYPEKFDVNDMWYGTFHRE